MKILVFSSESLILVLISGRRWVLKLEQLFPLKVRKAEKRAEGIFVPAERKTHQSSPGARQAGPQAQQASTLQLKVKGFPKYGDRGFSAPSPGFTGVDRVLAQLFLRILGHQPWLIQNTCLVGSARSKE